MSRYMSSFRSASCSDDKTIKIWIRMGMDWKCCSTLSGYHTQPIYSISWSKVSGRLASVAGDNMICLFEEVMDHPDQFSYSLVTRVDQAHTADINCVRWHPTNPSLFVTCGDDDLVKIWSYPFSDEEMVILTAE
jgi:cytosolic iron-sulfur protein assembly protein CIAO1